MHHEKAQWSDVYGVEYRMNVIISGLVQDYSVSTALAMEILQYSIKPSVCHISNTLYLKMLTFARLIYLKTGYDMLTKYAKFS